MLALVISVHVERDWFKGGRREIEKNITKEV
jgi:hypothetical protein